MLRTIRAFVVAIVTLPVILATFALAGEVQVRAVPKPVMGAATTRFKTAKFVGAATETTATGQKVYEVTLKDKGLNIDMMVTPEGTITLIEKQIERKDLPQALADTLNKRYPKAKYLIYEQVYTVEGGKETLAYYETMLVDPKKQTWAVELELNGAVRKIENKTGEVD